MKPKTKLQKQIVELSKRLPNVTEKQELYAYKHCLNHEATRLKNGTVTCLDCGHKWKDTHTLATTLDCTCPNCKTKLKVLDTRKQKFHDWAYYGIVTIFEGFQVFRYYKVNGVYKAGKPVYHNFYEVAQIWLSPKGEYEIVGYIHQSGWYSESWSGNFELRNKSCSYNYDIKPYKTHPTARYIPEIKRNGFTGSFHGMRPVEFYSLILRSNEAETLLKCGEIEWLKLFADDIKSLKKCWPAIRVVLRHKINIKDKRIWKDYISLLTYFGKDIRNPNIICPADLNKEHDRYVKKKRKQDAQLERKKRLKKLAEEEIAYEKSKGKFFGLEFTNGVIRIKVLSSVQEVMNEGDVLHHCVYTNKYYTKNDSLLLSASLNGNCLETIEVDIKQWRVSQSRGLQNHNTEYHDRIISLVNKNMHLIKERLKPKKNGTKKDVNRIPQAVDMAV